jgi:imidazolonepropionase-like amidohydrolase
MVPQAHEAVRRCIAAGVTVLAGTDAGTPFNRHGDLLRELRLLAGLGLGNDGAIRAATSAAAATLRLDGLGIVAPGKRADLVLVAGDPLADLDALAEPRVVVQNGKTRVVT